MKLEDKYTNKQESDKINIDNNYYALCEMIQELIIELKRKHKKHG